MSTRESSDAANVAVDRQAPAVRVALARAVTCLALHKGVDLVDLSGGNQHCPYGPSLSSYQASS